MPSRILKSHLEREPALARMIEIDAEIAKIGGRIAVLKSLRWPPAVERRFLKDFKAGRTRLPKVQLQRPALEREARALDRLMRGSDDGHPLGRWLHRTAWSYRLAVAMLRNLGHARFTLASVALYGRPDARPRGQPQTHLELAEHVLRITDELLGRYRVADAPETIPARRFARRVRERIADFFTEHEVRVELIPALPSRATAGSRRICVRADATFSELELEQLVQHEAFVHTATALNGRRQRYFKSLGLGSPRTTPDQEGLAAFAEIMSGALDVNRLRRLALRVRMVQRALDGADFIEVFKGFLDAGQSEAESFKSSQRIFRGGDARGGGVCFTKDCAYLSGMLRVYAFMLQALHQDRPELINAIFAGRMTVADVIELAPYFESGLFRYALYVPPWAQDARRLLAVLSFFTVASRLRLEQSTLQGFTVAEDEVYQDSLRHWHPRRREKTALPGHAATSL